MSCQCGLEMRYALKSPTGFVDDVLFAAAAATAVAVNDDDDGGGGDDGGICRFSV